MPIKQHNRFLFPSVHVYIQYFREPYDTKIKKIHHFSDKMIYIYHLFT